MPSDLYRHKKRGAVYRIVLRGKLQLDGPHDMAPVVVYEDVDAPGTIWVRQETEFFDGRFEQVETPAAAQQQGGG